MKRVGGERGGLIVRLMGLVMLAVVVLALFFFRFALMREAGEWLVVSDALQPSNAIIVLSGDDVDGNRAARANGGHSRTGVEDDVGHCGSKTA